MKLGLIMLAHTALHRAEQVARYWARNDCPVVLHIDSRVSKDRFERLESNLADVPNLRFCRRHACEWGTWSLVAAMQEAAKMLLAEFPEVNHVYAASGSCLPLRPASDLRTYLASRPQTDFIESVTTADVAWTVGGIDYERFTLHFPFAWRTQRKLFDRWVDIQRRLGLKRRMPEGIVPHLGSQWWCLTRQTLTAIFDDPRRDEYESYFRRVWIPDESYFQTLVRLYSRQIESRSLTLAKFDFQGKPHIFYDDHLQLLRRSDCFMARKIWPRAERLYGHFLLREGGEKGQAEPQPGKIDRVFSKATELRTRGRPGLYMQSRFPKLGFENGKTAGPYSMFEGFSDLFEDFETWLSKYTGTRVHGHLFGPRRAEFAGGETIFNGAICDNAATRDYNPDAFLANLIWATRGERQCFQFGPRDSQKISGMIASDPNAQISVVSGAWAIPLFRSNRNFGDIRRDAALLQKTETEHLEILLRQDTKARVRIWNLADFAAAPMEPLQTILDEIAPTRRRLTEVPRMVELGGFGQFLQNLRNQGMQPTLMGDFPAQFDSSPQDSVPSTPAKPYLVR